jgi:hypothetical protein
LVVASVSAARHQLGRRGCLHRPSSLGVSVLAALPQRRRPDL